MVLPPLIGRVRLLRRRRIDDLGRQGRHGALSKGDEQDCRRGRVRLDRTQGQQTQTPEHTMRSCAGWTRNVCGCEGRVAETRDRTEL